jgi:hypothetical protein
MDCARAFGACATLCDAPSGGEQIPESFQPNEWHLKKARSAKAELEALLALSPEEQERKAADMWEKEEESRKAYIEAREQLRNLYLTMLDKVHAWKPPTPDHVPLHIFMREQIEQSISFDCGTKYDKKPSLRLTGPEWKARETERLQTDIVYHEQAYAEEVARVTRNTAWVKALRDSLSGGSSWLI